jgi:hypothetical protein
MFQEENKAKPRGEKIGKCFSSRKNFKTYFSRKQEKCFEQFDSIQTKAAKKVYKLVNLPP